MKYLLDRISPNIIFLWSGKVILGLGFASPNITLPDQINMIMVSVLSNKFIISLKQNEGPQKITVIHHTLTHFNSNLLRIRIFAYIFRVKS